MFTRRSFLFDPFAPGILPGTDWQVATLDNPLGADNTTNTRRHISSNVQTIQSFFQRIYPGPREIFMTNRLWPGRREHMVTLYGEAETVWLVERFSKVAATQGHVVVRVAPGGDRYQVIVIDDTTETGNVLSVDGPYPSRGAPKALPGG